MSKFYPDVCWQDMCNAMRDGNVDLAVELSQKLLDHVKNGGTFPKIISGKSDIDRLKMLQCFSNIDILEQNYSHRLYLEKRQPE